MQTEFTFRPRDLQRANETFSIQRTQFVLTILSLAVAFFAVLELSLS